MRSLALVAMMSLLAVAVAAPPLAHAKKPATTTEVPTALQEYVAMPDDSYGYKLEGTEELDGCTVHQLTLTSQTWQGIPWKHALNIYVPGNIQHEDTVLLFITGGKTGGQPGQEDMLMGAKLAQAAAVPVAYLHQVPNQPLFGDRVEDDLITDTFLRYLETKDATWPLLFPMVKSAVSAMTAVQEFGKEKYDVSVERFVVTGGSKRGWTSWLTAVADERVAGIAPIVINTLNFRPQMDYQLETWGEYSEQIADYTSKGLVDVMINQPEIPLWRWVDPYTYREQLTLPKLLINGTNDRYWTVDAANLYWDDLKGDKYLRYVPNAGHGLDDGKEAALMTLAAFTQNIAAGKAMPKITWNYSDGEDEINLKFDASPAPQSARVWIAQSETKDFRDAEWKATELQPVNGGKSDGGGENDGAEFIGVVPKPESGHVALFGEATFAEGPLKYNLSTGLRRE